jgi:hypothetical protein
MLEEVSVVTGSRVEWVDRRNDARLITWVINPVGPARGQGVGATTGGEAQSAPPALPPHPGQPVIYHPAQATSPTLLEVTTPLMMPDQLSTLHKLAEERQRQVAEGVNKDAVMELMRRAKDYLASARLPRPLRLALGRCL